MRADLSETAAKSGGRLRDQRLGQEKKEAAQKACAVQICRLSSNKKTRGAKSLRGSNQPIELGQEKTRGILHDLSARSGEIFPIIADYSRLRSDGEADGSYIGKFIAAAGTGISRHGAAPIASERAARADSHFARRFPAYDAAFADCFGADAQNSGFDLGGVANDCAD